MLYTSTNSKNAAGSGESCGRSSMDAPVFPYQETRGGDFSALRHWLSQGGKIDAPLLRSVAETWTPLALACAEGRVELVRAIVEIGGARPSFSAQTKVLASSSPLHVASRYGHAGAAAVLLELGAVVDARDTFGFTPLCYAAGNGHLKTIEVLLGAGADTSSSFEAPYAATPLEMAEMAGFDDAATLLRSRALAGEDGGEAVRRRKALASWLGVLGCQEFLGRFLRAGYDDLQFMASQGLTEADLDCVGVPSEKLGLRKKLLAMHGVEVFLNADGGSSGSSSNRTEEASAAETASQGGSESSSSGGSSYDETGDERDASSSDGDETGSSSGNGSDSGSDSGSGA
ncbi:unnamed protein product [Ectocarpus sp. 4 AP-2014]